MDVLELIKRYPHPSSASNMEIFSTNRTMLERKPKYFLLLEVGVEMGLGSILAPD
jgi:hypothetical protein